MCAEIANFPDSSEPREPRLPPANMEAEQALLANLLANNLSYEKVSDFLRPEHFADRAHARIYEACGKLIERGQLASAVTIRNAFQNDEDLADVGGVRYLDELQEASAGIVDARHFGRIIYDLFLRRQLIDVGEDMVNEAFDFDFENGAVEQIEDAEQRLFKLAESGQTEGGLQPFVRALTESIEATEAAYKRDGRLVGVSTGLIDLDKLLGGLHKSDLVILAARPAMGKTSLATNIAYSVASARRRERDATGQERETPELAAFFSLEMSAEQLASRILSTRSGVRSDSMRRGELSQDDMQLVMVASRELETLRLYIDDTPAITVPALRTRARRLKRQEGLSLIVVDYLQLMRPANNSRSDGRVQEVSEITRGLKAIAKELDVPVVALSQLSRAVEQREDKRPQLADLRESGSIEQDADIVMFIYRDDYYHSRSEPIRRPEESQDKFDERVVRWNEHMEKVKGLAEVIVAKQRHGPTGKVTLMFNADTTEFSNYSPPDHYPDAH